MAHSLSNDLETKLINATLRNLAYTSPVTVYVALFTADPGEAGAGAEVTGGSYARKPVVFSAPVDGEASSSADVVWTNMPAGTVTHLAVFDALTLGNSMYYGPLGTETTPTPKVVNAGDTFTIPSTGLKVKLT